MSWSARNDTDAREIFDAKPELTRKITRVAAHLRRAKHAIVFTGAGLSTAAGIPDFRSGMGTALPTGPGLWAAQADYERRHPQRTEFTKNDPKRPRVDLDTMLAKAPTLSHRAIARLVAEGMVQTVITQNVDNLHRRSGVPRDQLVELHGNLQCERCEACGRDHERDFRIGPNPGRQHVTGRACEHCGGRLKDYLVPFGEDLPERETGRAWHESEVADLCLVLGSSLTVTPACEYAGWVAASTKRRYYGGATDERGDALHGALAIVNLQRTPYDGDADVVAHALCDDAMRELMSQLGLTLEE